jgi:CDP-glucose 4,6-dehydratase
MGANVVMNFYFGKTVLITGHTGFKGTWLAIWLASLGAKVIGLSDRIPTKPSNFEVSNLQNLVDDRCIDIRDFFAVKQLVEEVQPDFIFHLAAQALVRHSYANPLDTFAINGMGTANVLESIRGLNKHVVAVMITSDKSYDNVEWAWGYRETDRIGGKDPYSGSKGVAELIIRSYLASFFSKEISNISLGVARAGNVIGGGDWADDRIVPDCVRAWACGETVEIRSPNATRPWQHVLEPLSGYLVLAEALAKNHNLHGESYNFGPTSTRNHTVAELIDGMSKYWKNVKWRDVSSHQHLHEAALLKLNCDKALADLSWLPTLGFEETVRLTSEWYEYYYEGRFESMHDFSLKQIKEYTRLAAQRGMGWAQE